VCRGERDVNKPENFMKELNIDQQSWLLDLISAEKSRCQKKEAKAQKKG
jgi:hypothetical protein